MRQADARSSGRQGGQEFTAIHYADNNCFLVDGLEDSEKRNFAIRFGGATGVGRYTILSNECLRHRQFRRSAD
jgi:hypothetical protein